MREIYVNDSVRTTSLEIPSDIIPTGNPTPQMEITIFKDNELVAEVQTVVYADGLYTITIPFSLIQEDAELRVRWEFEYTENGDIFLFSTDTFVSVVTPYLSLREIASMVEDEDDFVEDDLREIEAATRHIINRHTGQFFGKTTATYRIIGNGKNTVLLPRRLFSLDEVNGLANSGNYYTIAGDGWYLAYPGYSSPSGITQVWPANQYAPIGDPTSSSVQRWGSGVYYSIKGKWGWSRVPNDVREAAKLLVNDYATGDTIYRDRYIANVKAADWSLQFHSGAYLKTGNARADYLLSEYVTKNGWAAL